MANLEKDREISPFINGRLSAAQGVEEFNRISPYSGAQLPTYVVASETDVDRAVDACQQAFHDGRWLGLAPSRRKTILFGLAGLIERDAASIDSIDAYEMGKPISLRLCNAKMGAEYVRYCAEAADKVMGDVLVSDSTSFITQRRAPYGIVAGVAAWNFPFYVALLKSIPALAAGNSVVLKPSEISPGSALVLAELAREAGVPDGVLNVLPGTGPVTGRALGLHPGVDMVSFTGSTQGGKAFMAYSAQSNLKKLLLECGGKSPQIVFEDGVDLDSAADAISSEILLNQGQWCSAGTRLLVQESVEQPLIEKLKARFAAVRMGDPLNPETDFGPLASAAHLARVSEHVRGGVASGATLLAGGQATRIGPCGNFFQPTLFAVPHSDPLTQTEIFGPVLTISTFKDESEAIALANATNFGLYAYLWCAEMDTALRVAKQIRSSVAIRSRAVASEGAGFAAWSEPVGQSGIGVEGGMPGIGSYLRHQQIAFFHG